MTESFVDREIPKSLKWTFDMALFDEQILNT